MQFEILYHQLPAPFSTRKLQNLVSDLLGRVTIQTFFILLKKLESKGFVLKSFHFFPVEGLLIFTHYELGYWN